MTDTPTYDAKYWLDEIATSKQRWHDRWMERGVKVTNRFLDKRGQEDIGRSKFNILYSNTETLKPILFSALPEPSVRRRFQSQSADIRKLSLVQEKALSYTADEGRMYDGIKRAVTDYLLPGRGTVRVTYKQIEEDTRRDVLVVETPDGLGGMNLPDDAKRREDGTAYAIEGEKSEMVFEEVGYQYVYWKHLLHGDAKTWEDVPWLGFIGFYTRAEIEEDPEFSKYADLLSYGYEKEYHQQNKRHRGTQAKPEEVTCIYEIWCKRTNKQYFVADGFEKEVIHEVDDPLGLLSKGLLPCPKPLYSCVTNDSLEPVPFFAQYQDQAAELDTLTDRITTLISELKRRGVYDAAMEDLPRLLKAADNTLVPVSRYSELSDRGGLQAVVGMLPVDDILQVVVALYQQREQVLNSVYEVIGLSDIMRGKTDPRETASAQTIKGNFGTLRVSEQQREVQRFIRDLYRISAEIIADNFEANTLSLMTGEEVTEGMMELMRDTYPRAFLIDIETESTVATDAAQKKQQAVELVEAMASFSQAAPGLAQTFGMMATKELFIQAFSQFGASRKLEEMLEESMAQIMAQQQEQGPSLEEQKVALDREKLTLESQLKQAELMLKDKELSIKQGLAVNKARETDLDAVLNESKMALQALALKAEMSNPNDNAVVGA